MKKRVFSLILALIFSIGLLPASAWAEGSESTESGAAQVTTAGDTEQVYGSFNDAWSAAIKSEGSTLKLLSDVELSNEVGENGLSVSEGSFTLDLNNKTLKGAIWNQLLEVSGTANITIKNGSLVNTRTGPAASASSTNLVALKISGGTVALDNVNLTSGINSEGKHSSALYITGGSLTVTGSTFTGEVGVFCENSGTRPALSIADATLNNGIFYWVADAQASDTAGLEAIFAADSMLFDQNSKYIDLASKEYWHIENVGAIFLYTEGCIVKLHTHKVENGQCACGATFAASVTRKGAVTYYKDFNTALSAANTGDTLTLLTDVKDGGTVVIDKAITFDLNGHKISNLQVQVNAIIKDSSGGKGEIFEWLKAENGLTIGNLLEPGYAFRKADNSKMWCFGTENAVGNVTVQQAPITKVTLTARNADGTAASTSIPYGTTNGIKLSASCDAKPGAGELSCQWYTIGGMALPIEGATKSVYQLPADLSEGTHGYGITFTADGYSKSDEITITVTKATPTDGGGGSSYSGDSNPTVKSETITNPDGSVTKTEIKADGTVITTTTKKDGSVTKTETKKDGTVIETTTNPDGSVIKTETKPDGSSVTETRTPDGSTGTVKTDENGRTEASVNVSRSAVEEVKATGNAVQIPAVVAASRNSTTAPTVEIHLPTNAGETKVEIPVSNVNSGTVAVLVHPDGTEEIVKSSIPTETGIQLTVTGSTTLKIIDNTKPFRDINGHWAENSINFVGARELFMGTGTNTFSPDIDMSRAQLWTVLARQENADLSGGSKWYEKSQLWAVDKGISDGTNPQDPISRAQMISMLWRTAGSPGTTDSPWFTDVPADAYYTDAVAWAAKNNITSGVGNRKFDPNAACTRAQVATFLRNAYENDIF